MSKGTDIIIVNYYSKKKLINVLKSINESLIVDIQLQVIIINNSPNESLEDLACNYELLKINNFENKGFGFACNQALKYCKYNYQLLLNPDTTLLPDTLYHSFLFLSKNTDVTVLGVKHLNENHQISYSCSRFPTLSIYLFDILGLSKIAPKIFKPAYLMTDWNHKNSRYVNQVMGAYLMIRSSFVKQNGLMDERFFVFLEDADLCKRVWASGGKVYYNSEIALIHEGASSTEGVSDKKTAYLMEGKLKYAYKYFSLWKYCFLLSAVIFIEPIARVFYFLITNPRNIKDVLKGYALFIKRHQFK